MTELLVLRHPSIRAHQNIVHLCGICWDVDHDGDAWPVLVFNKSEHGNLDSLMSKGLGKSMSLEERLKLCAAIGEAVLAMHTGT